MKGIKVNKEKLYFIAYVAWDAQSINRLEPVHTLYNRNDVISGIKSCIISAFYYTLLYTSDLIHSSN